MRHKLVSRILYFALLLIGVSITILLFWLYSPPKEALSVSPNPIPVISKVVKEDSTCAVLGYNRCAVLKFTRCKNVKSSGRITITLVGRSSQLPLPTVTDTGERKCENDKTAPFPIPPQTTPGEYHFHFRTTYKVNPLTTLTQDFDSESFVVQ